MIELGERVLSPLSEQAHAAVRTELAGPHDGSADGRFRYSDDTPENRLAQRSLYNRNESMPGSVVDAIATNLQRGYPEIVGSMHKGHQAVMLDQIAEGLESKKKIVIDMNHAGLIHSGIGFRAVCSALEDLGVEFDTASVEGIMLPHLKVWLNKEDPPLEDDSDKESGGDGFMPTQSGVALVSRNALKAIPNTDNTGELRKRFTKEVSAHTKLYMEVFRKLMASDIGMLVLIIGSGTHDRRKADDPNVIEMKPVAPGLINMFVDNELEVAEMALVDVDGYPFDAILAEGPSPVTSLEQMARRKGRLARLLGEQVAGVSYEYQRP